MTRDVKPKPGTAADFARRLNLACDNSDRVPPYNFGRQTYIATELGKQFGVTVTKETARKWFAGEVRPRPDKMRALAALLKVDEAWLALGNRPDLVPDERKLQSAAIDGSISLVVGMLTLNGANCAFPDPDDPRKDIVHFYTIISGRQYAIHVSRGQQTRSGFRFVVPSDFERVFALGVVMRAPTQFDLYHLSPAAISKFGRRRGGYIELDGMDREGMISVRTETLKKVDSFTELS